MTTLLERPAAASSEIMQGAEMMMRIADTDHGVLLLHGFLGSPFDMKYLAYRLLEKGRSIYVPRYPGHGTNLTEMTHTTGQDWYRAAREAYLELRSRCLHVSVVGLSMGAAFATMLAQEFEIEQIALLSMPRAIPDRMIYLAPLVARFTDILYRSEEQKAAFNRGLYDPVAREQHVGYFDGTPVGPSWELHKILKRAMQGLNRVHSRTLLIQSVNDDTIPPDSLNVIADRISGRKEVMWLERSNHAITLDYDREQVADRIIEFLQS